jgi:acyl carrier protein
MTIDAKTMLAKVLEIEPFEVPDDASIESYERWDSLGHMQLTLILETHMGRPLDTEEILSIMDLESLDRLIATIAGRSNS